VTDLEFLVPVKRDVLPQMMKLVFLSMMMGKLVIEIGESHNVDDVVTGVHLLQVIYDACSAKDGAEGVGPFMAFENCIRTPFWTSKEQVSF
jgi:hypothetical protein